jgi:hypothetical protein
MAATIKVKVLQALTHCGKPYAKGDEFEVDPGTAFQLVQSGMVIPVPVPVAAEPVKPVAPVSSTKGREA